MVHETHQLQAVSGSFIVLTRPLKLEVKANICKVSEALVVRQASDRFFLACLS